MDVETLHTGASKTRFIRVDLKTRHRGASNVKTPCAVLVIVIDASASKHSVSDVKPPCKAFSGAKRFMWVLLVLERCSRELVLQKGCIPLSVTSNPHAWVSVL